MFLCLDVVKNWCSQVRVHWRQGYYWLHAKEGGELIRGPATVLRDQVRRRYTNRYFGPSIGNYSDDSAVSVGGMDGRVQGRRGEQRAGT